jgi:uncharacterized membrane protein HdeD (DUF308 family)
MYWVTGVLGLILAVSPFVFGYSDNTAAFWTSILIGAATIVVSLLEGIQDDRKNWEYWMVIVFGAVTIVAPFLLGFSNLDAARWTSVIVGVLFVLFAGTRLTAGPTEEV